jgi:hypothetical protein
MNKPKSQKRKITIVTISIVLILSMIFAAYMQFVRPLSVEGVYIWIESFSEQELEIRKDYFNRYVENNYTGDNQFIRLEDPFPSDDYNDYCHVRIFLHFNNRSIFNMAINDGFIKNPIDVQSVIYKRPIAISTTISRFNSAITDDCYELFFWKNGMSDDDILNYVKKINLEIYYENDISNSKKINVSLSDAHSVSFDELDDLRKLHNN